MKTNKTSKRVISWYSLHRRGPDSHLKSFKAKLQKFITEWPLEDYMYSKKVDLKNSICQVKLETNT